MQAKCVVLIGFKHVGKSVIGDKLAQRLHLPFLDLDRVIEEKKLTCRQIMQIHGQVYFRALEKEALSQVMNGRPAVIALGGGTLIDTENQAMIKGSIVAHITADRHTVYNRIMQQGQPAFFSPDMPPLDSFNQLWNEREPIYKKLAHFTVENNDLIENSVDRIASLLTKMSAQ